MNMFINAPLQWMNEALRPWKDRKSTNLRFRMSPADAEGIIALSISVKRKIRLVEILENIAVN